MHDITPSRSRPIKAIIIDLAISETAVMGKTERDYLYSIIEEAKNYRAYYGHLYTTQRENSRLSKWMVRTRDEFKYIRNQDKYMTLKSVKKLLITERELPEFVWEPQTHQGYQEHRKRCREGLVQKSKSPWRPISDKTITYLKNHKTNHGHFNIDPESPFANAVAMFRTLNEQQVLFDDWREQLDAIQFDYRPQKDPDDSYSNIQQKKYVSRYADRYKEGWDNRFNQLINYKKLNGHTNVNTKGSLLGDWVRNQRVRYGQDKLIEEQLEKLKSIGFEFDPGNIGMPKKEILPPGANDKNPGR